MKTVLLKFAGPLQSWGTDSHFETRHTDTHPSKSAVIGMIAAGLGIKREDEAALRRLNKLKFAVRVDQSGELLRDYHIAQKYKDNGDFERIYVTNRYYLQDAVFVVALGSDDEGLIQDVMKALDKPYFQIFLGRRALPPTMDLFQGIVDTDVITALSEHPWQAAERYQRRHNGRLEVFADAELLPSVSVRIRNDEVTLFSQRKGRKFNPRREARTLIDMAASTDLQEEHDAFGALGED